MQDCGSDVPVIGGDTWYAGPWPTEWAAYSRGGCSPTLRGPQEVDPTHAAGFLKDQNEQPRGSQLGGVRPGGAAYWDHKWELKPLWGPSWAQTPGFLRAGVTYWRVNEPQRASSVTFQDLQSSWENSSWLTLARTPPLSCISVGWVTVTAKPQIQAHGHFLVPGPPPCNSISRAAVDPPFLQALRRVPGDVPGRNKEKPSPFVRLTAPVPWLCGGWGWGGGLISQKIFWIHKTSWQ